MNKQFLKDKKYFIGGFLVLLLIGLAIYTENKRREQMEIKFDERGVVVFPEKDPNEGVEDYAKRVENLRDRIMKMMAEDDVGGETPEETLQLFIDALKAGDIELASKYFVVSDQAKKLDELMELNQQQIVDYIDVLEIGNDISCNDISNWCELHGMYQEVNILIARFEQMKQSGIWKMESL